jgi:hypothetical protein
MRGRRGPEPFAARAGTVGLFVAATAALILVSRGKWSDPLIDSGREWIVPDGVARGELLYRDVVYWFGPFTPYFQAAFLGLFGSGFGSLVAAGAVAAIATLCVLFAVLRRVTTPAEALAWTALAVPALIFMPNAGGALLGMGYRIWHAAAFALLAVLFASSPRHRVVAAVLAGGAAALAGLCRTEWGLAAAGAAALACVVRGRNRGRGFLEAVLAGAAAAAVFAAGLGHFLSRAGKDAVLRDGHILLTGLPPETRHFLVAFSGIRDWPRGVAELAYSAAMWSGLFLLAGILVAPSAADRARRLRWLAVVALVLVASAAAGGAAGAVLFSAAPLVSLAGLVAGLRRGKGSAAATLAACGALGLILSYRRPFHIGDSAYVAPPLLFAFVAAAGLLRLAVARRHRRPERLRLSTGYRGIVVALVALAFLLRAGQYRGIEGRPIAGTSGMLTARPELAREIEELGGAIRARTGDGDGLAVFPEGEVLNFLSTRRNPIRHRLYLPGYLSADNEAAVLAELEAASPAAVVLWQRPVSEYDRAMFGEDYGRDVRAWIDAHYDLQPFRATGAPPRSHPRFILGFRRNR